MGILLVFFFIAPVFAVEIEDYVIGDGDGLQVSVWAEPALSTTVTVRPDGKITLPGVGDIAAAGFTPPELSMELTKKLKNFVNKPIVTVTVTSITNNKIYVFGGGVPPGVSNLPGRTTLLKFMIRYGNFRAADMANAYVLRNGEKLNVNFYDLLIKGDMSKDMVLKSEDIIYVPDNELNKIYIMGAVGTPKYIYYREGLRILDAIFEAGGFTKVASENSVFIKRKGDSETAEVRVRMKDLMTNGDLSQNIPLQPGDYVVVKESIF
jgi:polysaccharide export outer membrane protein